MSPLGKERGVATGIYRAESRDAAKHPHIARESPPTPENDQAQEMSTAPDVEKLWW